MNIQISFSYWYLVAHKILISIFINLPPIFQKKKKNEKDELHKSYLVINIIFARYQEFLSFNFME